MIQAKELRIGNWVNVDSDTDGTLIENIVVGTMEDGRCYLSNWLNIAMNPERIEGIPLTPEILEKAGFTKEQTFYKDSTWHKRDNIEIHEGGVVFFTDTYENTVQLPVNIQYVHQLQNLYFALTGEELQIEL